MSTKVITAECVDAIPHGGTLPVPAGAVVTPLARDVAAERHVTLQHQTTPPRATATAGNGTLEATVRQILSRVLAESGATTTDPTQPRVKVARFAEAELEPFGHPGPGPDQQVRALDVVTSRDGSPMGAGYLSLTEGSFPWTLDYDEVQIVLEGELHLGGDGDGVVGRPGDVLFVPKGSSITFGTPTWAKFVYVTFPADWAEQT